MKVIVFIILLLSAVGAWLYFNPAVWEDLLGDTPLGPQPTVTKLYKWQDASGRWQVSDKPPAGNIHYEIMQFRSDTNVVPALKETDDED